jgi:hypothetical protein
MTIEMRSATWPFLIKIVCLQRAGSDRVIDDVSAPSTWYAIEASVRRWAQADDGATDISGAASPRLH